MRKITFILSMLATSCAMASPSNASEISTPTVELVKVIYNFCLEQLSEQSEPDIEKYILGCVNSDLEISSYQTFDTYTELTSFISTTNGE